MSPADRRTREIKNEYVREFRNLDKVFACEFVGDGTGAVVGPFERAQQCFHSKQIVPLCAGWFGEVNKGIVVIRKELARLASAGEMSLSISPLANTDKKGAAYPIMWQQFKQAISVAVIRGNSMHKLGRLHYVRGTTAEATTVATAHHCSNPMRP
mmetsp:Transcript_1861/g.3305  ORF Transcript_1861/g.3305 Transcript_1861/m.3305 type:complete len:155 (-) Transcript_1861:268-732(-)